MSPVQTVTYVFGLDKKKNGGPGGTRTPNQSVMSGRL